MHAICYDSVPFSPVNQYKIPKIRESDLSTKTVCFTSKEIRDTIASNVEFHRLETDKEKIVQRGAPSLEPYLRGSGTKMVRRIRDHIESGQHAFGFGTGFLLLFKKTPLVRLCQECQGSLDFVYDRLYIL